MKFKGNINKAVLSSGVSLCHANNKLSTFSLQRSWCDQYGDLVLDVVKKEFKDHVGEMEKLRNAARERHNHSTQWTTFDDDENCHPNLFAANKDYSLPQKQPFDSNCFEENPFFQNYAQGYGRKY